MGDVVGGSCNQIVYGNNPESLGDQAIAHVGSEKSGSPGNNSNLFRRNRFKHTISKDFGYGLLVFAEPAIHRLPWVTSSRGCLPDFFDEVLNLIGVTSPESTFPFALGCGRPIE